MSRPPLRRLGWFLAARTGRDNAARAEVCHPYAFLPTRHTTPETHVSAASSVTRVRRTVIGDHSDERPAFCPPRHHFEGGEGANQAGRPWRRQKAAGGAPDERITPGCARTEE